MAGIKLDVILPGRVFPALDRLRKQLVGLSDSTKKVSTSGKLLNVVLGKLGVYGLAAVVVIKTLSAALNALRTVISKVFNEISKGVDRANSVKRFEVIFTTLEGSADRARNSIDRFLRLSESSPFDFEDIARGARYFQTLDLGILTTSENLRAVADEAFTAGISFQTQATNLGRTLDDLRNGRNVGQSVYSLNRTGLLGASARNELERLQKIGTADANRKAWETVQKDLQRTHGATRNLNKTFSQLADNIQTKVTDRLARLSEPILNGLVPALERVAKVIDMIDLSWVIYSLNVMFNDVINPGITDSIKLLKEFNFIFKGISDIAEWTTRVMFATLSTISLLFAELSKMFDRLRYGLAGAVSAAFTKVRYAAETAFYSIAQFLTFVFEYSLHEGGNLVRNLGWMFENGFKTTTNFIYNLFLRLKSLVIGNVIIPLSEALNAIPGIGANINIGALRAAQQEALDSIEVYRPTPKPKNTDYVVSERVKSFERSAEYAKKMFNASPSISEGYMSSRLDHEGQPGLTKLLYATTGAAAKIATFGRNGENNPVSIENDYLEPTFKASSETAKNTKKTAEYLGKIFDNIGWEAKRVSIGLNKGSPSFGLGTATHNSAKARFKQAADNLFGHLNSVNQASITSG